MSEAEADERASVVDPDGGRMIMELQGETVLRAKPVIGYQHTGMEKTAEDLTYLQGPTNVTRMDYAAPLFTELTFSLAVEALLEIDIPV